MQSFLYGLSQCSRWYINKRVYGIDTFILCKSNGYSSLQTRYATCLLHEQCRWSVHSLGWYFRIRRKNAELRRLTESSNLL